MKFVCEQSAIHEALSIVSRAVPAKSPISSLEGVKLLLNKDTLELTGYDLELGIKTKIKVESEDCGELILNAKLFCEIIRKMPCGNITVTVNDGMQTLIHCENAEYSVMALSTEEYPSIPDCEEGELLSFSQPLLKNMVNQTIYAVSVVDNKPILTGELFDIEDNIFNLVAIDGFRLAVRKESISNGNKFNFVVKAKALSEVAKLLKDDDKSELTLHVSKKHVIFEIGEYMVISRILEGEFHNYKGSIPDKHQTEITLKTKSIIGSLERSSLLINEKAKGPVKCLFKDGTAKISCSTAVGKLNEEFPIEITGPAVEIGFNCRYLLEAFKASESDKVKMQLNGSLSPMKIVPVDGDDYVFLVLPVRLGN
ncbi:MAG: DNA polymerase III subunit beta [Oscillospiraceae bacterium]|nr:DNA polymerase III subunit beta [Oscillospiraceae bacterium]